MRECVISLRFLRDPKFRNNNFKKSQLSIIPIAVLQNLKIQTTILKQRFLKIPTPTIHFYLAPTVIGGGRDVPVGVLVGGPSF